jgi:hypothetical protein
MQRREASTRQSLTAILGWTRSSYVMLSLFLATLVVVIVVWWPLMRAYFVYLDFSRPLIPQIDWLLLGNFCIMSFLIMVHPDFKQDTLIILVGLAGGLAIEGWGTQTDLWHYYTAERPPLWIIPAWPIASLSISRLVRFLDRTMPLRSERSYGILYWISFSVFYIWMLAFVWPFTDKSLTILALTACALMIVTPTDRRLAVLTFAAGTGLGFFLELWGTTRYCWTYYTEQQPPLFAVLAHGMAAVAFWRAGLLFNTMARRLVKPFPRRTVQRTDLGRTGAESPMG